MASDFATARAKAPQSMLLRPEEVAIELRIARRRVWEKISSGELPSVKIGKSRRVSRAALEAYVRQLTEDGGDDAPAA
jgi:excisionase family DNA binding protein